MNHLQEIAFARQERDIAITIGPDESAALKEELLQLLLELDNLATDLANVKAEFKERMDPLKLRMGVIKQDLRLGQRFERKTVYLVQNFETMHMDYMTEEGEVVFSRILLPNEREQNIIFKMPQGAQA